MTATDPTEDCLQSGSIDQVGVNIFKRSKSNPKSKIKKQKVIFIMGLPGSGKTYLAKMLAERINVEHISSDVVRKSMKMGGHYSGQDKQLVYDQMMTLMQKCLAEQKDVLVDSTFYLQSARDEFEELALNYTDEIYWILATADESTIKERVSQKRPDSEADYSVYLAIRDKMDPIQMGHLVIETDKHEHRELLEKILAYCHIQAK